MTLSCPACKSTLNVDLQPEAARDGLTPIRCEGCRHKFHVRLRQSIVVVEQPKTPAVDETVNPFVQPAAPPPAPTPAREPAPVRQPQPAETEFQHDIRNLYPSLKRNIWAMLGSPWHNGWFIALLIALTLLPFSLPGLFIAWVITLCFRPGKRPDSAAPPAPAPSQPAPVPRARREANVPTGAEVGDPIHAGPSESIAVGEPLSWVLKQDQRRAS